MNYIYDIYVNFQKQYYDFYEWNKKDQITHIKRIPVFKINEYSFKNIIRNETKIDLQFVELLKDKTDIFNTKNKITACLFTDGKDIVAAQLNKDGNVIKKSSLLLDEEYDILRGIDTMPAKNLNIQKVQSFKKSFLTRNEIARNRYILRNISKMDDKKILYLYFECFNKEETNRNKVENKIKQEIIKNNDKVCSISYNFLKLIYS